MRDGDVWTAAGVSAGIDLALAFIAAVAGETVAGKIQLGAEYYPSGRCFGTLHRAVGPGVFAGTGEIAPAGLLGTWNLILGTCGAHAPLDVLRVRLVLLRVTAFLPLMVDQVLFDVGLVDIVGAQAQHLRERNQK